jgi:hypothetical protein
MWKISTLFWGTSGICVYSPRRYAPRWINHISPRCLKITYTYWWNRMRHHEESKKITLTFHKHLNEYPKFKKTVWKTLCFEIIDNATTVSNRWNYFFCREYVISICSPYNASYHHGWGLDTNHCPHRLGNCENQMYHRRSMLYFSAL